MSTNETDLLKSVDCWMPQSGLGTAQVSALSTSIPTQISSDTQTHHEFWNGTKKMEANNYIVCLLDLEHNRQQKGIFFLTTNTELQEVAMKFGISPRLRNLMGRRWEIHINEEPHKVELMGCSLTVANLMVKITKTLEEKAGKTIIIPPHHPTIVPEVYWDGE